VALVDAVDGELGPGPRANLREFRELVLNGEYALHYGDIPCRPLFLRMVIDDVIISGVRRLGRVDLFDEWINNKLFRDHYAPMEMGGAGRLPLVPRASSVDETIRVARSV